MPLPIRATLFSFWGTRTRVLPVGVWVTQARSSSPMAMGSPVSPSLHRASQGWSQMRPKMAGKGRVLSRTFRAAWVLPWAMCCKKRRASTWRGQAALQKGGSSWMHRCSSSLSSFCSIAPHGWDSVCLIGSTCTIKSLRRRGEPPRKQVADAFCPSFLGSNRIRR